MRNRLYWTNIPQEFGLPKDTNCNLQDILTSGYTTKKKAYCLLESESSQKTNYSEDKVLLILFLKLKT